MHKYLSKHNPEVLPALKELSRNFPEVQILRWEILLQNASRGGVAFHHAGLRHTQRSEIENAFKNRILYCLCATPTLAAGVNLPARRVLIRDLKRFEDGMSRLLPVMEVRQMLEEQDGQGYDPVGEAWLACKGGDPRQVADDIADRYIHGPVEDISSKLAANRR